MGTIEQMTPAEAAVAGGIVGGMLTFTLIITVVWYIMLVIAGWKIFEKAGEKGWKALIPVYNMYILYKIVGMSTWFLVMLCFGIFMYFVMAIEDYNPNMTAEQMMAYNYSAHPLLLVTMIVVIILGIIVTIEYAQRTSKAFGHGIGFTIGIILLPDVFRLILGFDKSKYNKKALKK